MKPTSTLFSLPDDVFYNILLFVEKPRSIVQVLCHQITPLGSAAGSLVSATSPIWELVLKGYKGSSDSNRSHTNRRTSKRLRTGISPKEKVMRAHTHIRDQTEMALEAVEDLATEKDTTKPLLSLARLRGIMKKYGPVVNINQISENGATFLVSCCLAEGVTEAVVLACVKELIEKYNADPNVGQRQYVFHPNHLKGRWDVSTKFQMGCLLAAVCGGFPTIVKYLLENTTVSIDKLYTSRIKSSHARKYVEGTFTTLKFAEKLTETAMEYGATSEELSPFLKCIKLLKKDVASHKS